MLKKHIKKITGAIISLIIIIAAIVVNLSTAPANFPKTPFEYSVPKGGSLYSVSRDMEIKGMIKSATFLKYAVAGLSFNRIIKAGDYKFDGAESSIQIAQRLYKGDFRQTKISVTIPEGTNVRDMALIFLKNIPNFNAPYFVKIANKEEGYLYPDTYLFFENVKSEEIVRTMKENFNKKISSMDQDIKASQRSLSDIVIMASLIEKESNNLADSKIISGILWKRLKEGMPLQVDAPFYYLTGRTGPYTTNDTKIKSPYNTYLNKGLPIGPITSPSLDSIRATVSPVNSAYYFYLTGTDKLMHYAVTYQEHLANKEKYIK